MKYRDTGWSAPYFDRVNRKVDHYKLSICDYSQNGCDAEFQNLLGGKIVQKAFLDDPPGEHQKSSQQKAEEWLLSLVPQERIDPAKPAFWPMAIRNRRGLTGYAPRKKVEPVYNLPAGGYLKEYGGYKTDVLYYVKRATIVGESNCPKPVLQEAIKCGLCLPNAQSIFDLSPLGLRVSQLVNEIDGRDEEWAALQLRKESSLWVLRAVLAYALCKNWRTPLKIAILDRIKMVGESREKTRAKEAAAC